MSKISAVTYNLVHGSFFAMNLIGLAWYCRQIFNLHYLIKYFSVQSFWLAILYSTTSLITRTRYSKITQILYQLAFTTNTIACLGYWVMVRSHVVQRITYSFTMCNDFTHTMPIVMLVVIHYLQNLQYFHLRNIKYQVYMLVLAVVINVVYTFSDAPVYHFMTYEDMGTPIYLLCGIVFIVAIFLAMMKITTIRQTKSLKIE